MAEIFNYSNVSSAMSNVMSDKDTCISALNKGTDSLQESLTKGSGNVAIAGQSAESMKAQWDELTNRFKAFAGYIEKINDKVQNAGSNNVNLESDIQAAAQKANR